MLPKAKQYRLPLSLISINVSFIATIKRLEHVCEHLILQCLLCQQKINNVFCYEWQTETITSILLATYWSQTVTVSEHVHVIELEITDTNRQIGLRSDFAEWKQDAKQVWSLVPASYCYDDIGILQEYG